MNTQSKRMRTSFTTLATPKLNAQSYIEILPGQGKVPIIPGWFTFKWEKFHHSYLEELGIALPYYIKFINWMGKGGVSE